MQHQILPNTVGHEALAATVGLDLHSVASVVESDPPEGDVLVVGCSKRTG